MDNACWIINYGDIVYTMAERFHLKQTFVVTTDLTQVIDQIINELSPLNIKINETTFNTISFSYAGNFLRAQHPVSWVTFGEITVEPSSVNPKQVQITVQLNLRKIKWFLILFPLILCSALTGLVYIVLGSSIQQILQALGWMYLMVMLSMFLGYLFVKQIVSRFFQTLCKSLPRT